MENNSNYVRESAELKEAAEGLVNRSLEMARGLLCSGKVAVQTERGGRKANLI